MHASPQELLLYPVGDADGDGTEQRQGQDQGSRASKLRHRPNSQQDNEWRNEGVENNGAINPIFLSRSTASPSRRPKMLATHPCPKHPARAHNANSDSQGDSPDNRAETPKRQVGQVQSKCVGAGSQQNPDITPMG